MNKISFGSLIILILCLAIATFIETGHGTEYVSKFIYGSYWFIGLWFLLVLTGSIWLIRKKTYKQPAVFILHLAFMVILSGAILTFTTGIKGHIHLREGVKENRFTAEKSEFEHPMPFTLSLENFQIIYYPGTDAPVNYISHVKVLQDGKSSDEEISMNNILSVNGFRFYQSSFDQDGKGTILSVNHDPLGIPVTYAGYILLGISMLWLLFDPKGNFRKLLNHPLLKGGLCLLLLFLPTQISAEPATINKAKAEKLGTIQIMYGNRVTPLQTFAKDFTLKLTGKTNYKDYTSEQVLAGWIFFPDEWKNESMIRIKNTELRQMLNAEEYAPLTAFFNGEGEYLLAEFSSRLHKEGKETPLWKAITEVDEKIQIIRMLQQGNMLTIFPYEEGGKLQWYSPLDELPESIDQNEELLIRNLFPLLKKNISRKESDIFLQTVDKFKIYQNKKAGIHALSENEIKAEIVYNKSNLTTILYRFNLALGILLFVFFCIRMVMPDNDRIKYLNKIFGKVSVVLLLCSFLSLTAYMGLRTYISGRVPLSNGYETMIFIAWCILLIALIFNKKFSLLIPFGFILSGFTLLVSSLGQMNPQITPLMPVLLSPWLSIHVSLIMISYALFAFTMLNGLTAIILRISKKDNEEYLTKLMIISRIFLYPAVFLLGAGIFVGAVWANVSWGRYWAWDPKEVWALISFLIYGLAFHLQSLPFFRKPLFFHIFMVVAFLSLLMTYFGVNYFLGGIHSYN